MSTKCRFSFLKNGEVFIGKYKSSKLTIKINNINLDDYNIFFKKELYHETFSINKLNYDTIVVERTNEKKGWDFDLKLVLKLKINKIVKKNIKNNEILIGKSKNSRTYISIDLKSKNISSECFSIKNKLFNNKFNLNWNNGILTVTRIDNNCGWEHNLVVILKNKFVYEEILIGKSKNPTTYISLDLKSEDISSECFSIKKNRFHDKFNLQWDNGKLTVTRIDKNCGWGQNLVVILKKRIIPKTKYQTRNRKNLEQFLSLASEHNLFFWLDFGTLLGIYRNNELIPWDYDSDVGMRLCDRELLISILKKKKIKYKWSGNYPPKSLIHLGINFKLDIFFWEKKNDYYYSSHPWCSKSFFSSHYIDNFDSIVYENNIYQIPSKTKNFLALRYGNSWHIPNSNISGKTRESFCKYIIRTDCNHKSFFIKPLVKNIKKQRIYDCIFTIGCFDKFHIGHEILLYNLRKKCKRLVVGIHNSESICQIKNLSPDDVQSFKTRQDNVLIYADTTFKIIDKDPTNCFKKFFNSNDFSNTDYCFIRGDDNKTFPGKKYIKTLMHQEYSNYSKSISSTILRHDKKISFFNKLLVKVTDTLISNDINYYLDCGTLLGVIREGAFIKNDTDVDLSIHYSEWNKLKNVEWKNYGLSLKRVIEKYPQHQKGNLISLYFDKTNKFYCDIYAMPAFPTLTNTLFNGKIYKIPIKPTLYLKQLYGNSWNKYSKKHANLTYHRNSGLVKSMYKKYWDKKYKIYKTKW